METMTDTAENSLIEGIAPKRVQHEQPLSSKEFKPWHTVRKQWVRHEQWRKETQKLFLSLNLDGRPLRYLSLPGEDMLDIRELAECCTEKGLRLKCLGFDEDARNRTSQIEVNISWNEVSSNIEPHSVILRDNIETLKNTNSQAFSYVNERGPFDIINLDLCGSISCVNHPDHHQVLNNLCEYQVNHSREPWLLFLTTRADKGMVNVNHISHYLENLKVNATSFQCFRDRLAEITDFNIHNYDCDAITAAVEKKCNGKNFVKFFAAGFSKWLLRLTFSSLISWKVEMLDTCWYRVGPNQNPNAFPNMLSLAFCFTPLDIALIDPSGLANSNSGEIIDEKSLAMGILEKTECFIDLDCLLDKDTSMYEKLFERSAYLLKEARYPVDGYSEWAEAKRIHFDRN